MSVVKCVCSCVCLCVLGVRCALAALVLERCCLFGTHYCQPARATYNTCLIIDFIFEEGGWRTSTSSHCPQVCAGHRCCLVDISVWRQDWGFAHPASPPQHRRVGPRTYRHRPCFIHVSICTLPTAPPPLSCSLTLSSIHSCHTLTHLSHLTAVARLPLSPPSQLLALCFWSLVSSPSFACFCRSLSLSSLHSLPCFITDLSSLCPPYFLMTS